MIFSQIGYSFKKQLGRIVQHTNSTVACHTKKSSYTFITIKTSIFATAFVIMIYGKFFVMTRWVRTNSTQPILFLKQWIINRCIFFCFQFSRVFVSRFRSLFTFNFSSNSDRFFILFPVFLIPNLSFIPNTIITVFSCLVFTTRKLFKFFDFVTSKAFYHKQIVTNQFIYLQTKKGGEYGN